jgi:hypothetical protein
MVGTVAGAVMLTLLGACASSTAALAPCPDDVTRVEIFNTYGDHAAADLHVLEGDDARTLCQTAFPYDRLALRSYSAAELEQRRITVMRFTGASEVHRTLWVYGLAGYDAGTALVLDDGTSFHLPNQGPAGYYAAEATVVPRSEVPRRG